MKYLILPLVLYLAGCVVDVHSQVDPIGNDMYRVITQSPSGLTGINILMEEAKGEAYNYCQKAGLHLSILQEIGIEETNVTGDFPQAEIHFKCNP